jgi:hypothetical protein
MFDFRMLIIDNAYFIADKGEITVFAKVTGIPWFHGSTA